MSYFKKTSIWIFILIIAMVLVAGYFFYNNVIRKTQAGIRAVPQSTVLFLEIPNTKSFLEGLSNNNKIWQSLSEITAVGNLAMQLKHTDSMAHQETPIADFLQTRSYLSIHQKNDSLYPLFILELNKFRQNSFLEEKARLLFGNALRTETTRVSGQNCLICSMGDSEFSIYVMSKNGLALMSTKKELLTDAMIQMNEEKGIANDAVFRKVDNTKGKNVDAHLYLHAHNAGSFAGLFADRQYKKALLELDHFSGWTELDIILKTDELLLNGYTASANSGNTYLDCFLNQEAPEISIPAVLPFNTSMMLHMGFEDFSTYYAAYEDYLKSQKQYQKYYSRIANINNRYQINLEEQLLSWFGSELSLSSTASKMNDFRTDCFLVVQTNEAVRANQLLTQITHNVGGSGIIKRFKDHLIKKINLPELFTTTLGEAFAPLHNPYYTIIDDYVVFANNVSALEEFINLNIAGKTLDGNVNYKEFSDNISESSNIYLYFNTRNALELLGGFSNPFLENILQQNQGKLNNFHAFALQFSFINNMFYTNTYLKYNTEYREESRAVWKTELDAPIIRKPFLVKDHTDNTYNIIVFDEDNQMYLIDNHGNILWKISYAGELMSEVYPVDYYKNRKVQYLFNTDEYIYLIDLLGRKVANYPIKLGTRASNGLAVFDYVKNKDYRLVFAGEDRKIYNYTIEGNSVKGWTTPRMKEEVNKKIQHLVSRNKDYIIIPMEDGSVEITDRRGRTRIRIRDNFNNALKSDFYTNRTNSKGAIITTDTQGHLTYIKTNGQLDRTVFQDFSPEHYFLYEDLDKSNGEDFIFLDGDRLLVFDRFKNVMVDYQFPNLIYQKPEVIRLSNRENLLGVVSAEENKLYLFDGQGNIVFDAGLTGSTRFAVGSLNNNKDLNLIIGDENVLYNYLIK
ncbi:MAG: DUF3352 domain-containing protein [Bacteroidales bacterium]|nr:DUF3352 domain-containing protein [Bacteroidales bacterium]MCF8396765.1 DUF3352 domain-containing protein [Bacteroidales bacterium]